MPCKTEMKKFVIVYQTDHKKNKTTSKPNKCLNQIQNKLAHMLTLSDTGINKTIVLGYSSNLVTKKNKLE